MPLEEKPKCKKRIKENLNTLPYLFESAKNIFTKIVKERETFTYNPLKKCAQKSPIFCSGRVGGSRMVVPIPKLGIIKKTNKK